jgi:hypothetical protein
VRSAILLLLAQLSTLGTTPPAPPSRPQSEIPVTLTVRVTEGRRPFRPGEIIAIELEFSSQIPQRFAVDGATYDRSGRLTIDAFRIEPIDAVTDPMLDYFASIGGYIGGGLRTTGALGEQPVVVKLQLNDWFRFDQAGTLRLSIRSSRVSDDAKTTRTIVPVESNTVSFDIVPRDTAWEATELEAARRLLDANGSEIDRRKGCRMMRFLGTDAAVNEMIRRYGANIELGCDFDYLAGLFSAPNREHVVRQMEHGLRAADQPVTASYLRTLAILSVYLDHPEFRPAQTREAKGRLVAGGEMSRHLDLIEAASARYADILTAALPEKTDRARAITLVERQGMPALSSRGSGSTVSRDRDQLATAFLELAAERQATLLEFQWSTIASPGMVPVLRRIVESSPTASRSVADLALRRLYDLAPNEARPLILREIQNPRQGATLKTLGRLADAELPELDESLAANFEASRDFEARGDFEGAGIGAEFVHRYASKKIADRILQSTNDQLTRMACRPQRAVLAYFLRVDDGIGQGLLDRALGSRASTGCRTSLASVAALRMTPTVEARAIADLDDIDPDVVIAAIETLGRHGSPAALAPLRGAFEQWHATWDGRASDLQYSRAADRPHARQAMVDDAFRQALGRGQGWLTRSSELRELGALCVTESCRTQISIMLDAADDTRIIILRVDEPGDSLIQLAQYQLHSISALEQKLAQFPRGASFTLHVRALDAEIGAAVVSKILAFADTHGIAVKQEP